MEESEMPPRPLGERIDELQRSAEDLEARASGESAVFAAEAITQLQATLAQLHAAEDELRAQNEELIQMRTVLEEERRRYHDLFEFAPDAYLVTDAHGVIVEANEAACELLQAQLAFLVGKPLAVYLPMHLRTAFRTLLLRVAREGVVRNWRLQMKDRDGGVTEVLATAAAARATGRAHSVRWALRDFTDEVRAEDQIRNLNEGLEQRVRERTAELEQANAAKDEFLGMVSHELNTPITTIMGNAEVLLRRIDQIDARNRTAALADIHQEAERLHHIIDNMLVLARLERGQQIGREPLLIQHMVHEAVERHQQDHPHRTLDVDIEPALPPVAAAPLYARQVLSNLLSNAEKYSPPALSIDIRVHRTDGEVEVAVRDYGGGLDAEEVERIFRPFYRSPRTAAQAPGVGIGLSVCKRLIEAQGGHIWARPASGGGLEIGFALPLEPPEDAPGESEIEP